MKSRWFAPILLGLILVLVSVSCETSTTQPEPTDRPAQPQPAQLTSTRRPPLPTKTAAAPPQQPTKPGPLPSPTQSRPTQNQPAGSGTISGEAVAGMNLEQWGSSFDSVLMTDYGHQLVAVGSRIAYVKDFDHNIESAFIPPVDEVTGNNTSLRTTDNQIVMADVNDLAGEGIVRLLEVNPASGEYERVKDIEAEGLTVITLEFSPDGRILAVGYNTGEIRLYDTDDGSQLRSIQAHIDNVKSLAFSYDGRYLASDSWSFDPFTYVFDTNTGAKLATLSTESYEPGFVSFSPDGRLVSATSSAGTHIFNTGNWQPTGTIIAGVWEGIFTCDSQMLMVFIGNAMTDLYSISSGEKVGTIEAAPLYCYSSELVYLDLTPGDNTITVIAYNP